MAKIMINGDKPVSTTHIREISCLLVEDCTSVAFTAIVENCDGTLSVSLDDIETPSSMPRQIEMLESEFLFWKEIFEKVILR